MRAARLSLLVACAGLIGAGIAWAQADVTGSQDHPLITRMPGYSIVRYQVEETGAFDPTVVDGPDVHWEGKKYAIDYARPDGGAPVSMLQIVRNYQNALKAVGARILGGDERRVAAELRKGNATTGVYVEAYNEGTTYSVTIVEIGAMRQDVVADASAMGRDIAASGRTVVRGIFFDTGSAVVKPESDAALAEMAKLLASRPALRAYVIGHTDNVGALDANLKLSADRADAVVKALVGRGAAAARLRAAGVGPYCPVGSNATEEGRSENRRVELVEQ